MHIGLIGGIGPAAAEYYYRGLVNAHAAANVDLQLTMVHASSKQLIANLAIGAAKEQAEIFQAFVERLKAAGADTAIVTSLGGHFCIKELQAISPLPLINAIPELDRFFVENNYARIGLLGTRTIMQTHIYDADFSVDFVTPEGAALDAVHESYVDMAMAAQVTPAQRQVFFAAGRQMCGEQGADAVLLAGTDLFLAFDGVAGDFPIIDGARIHIDAITRASLESK